MRVARLFRAAPGRRRVSADVRAAVLSQLFGEGPGDQHRARREADRNRTCGHGQGAFRELGFRGERRRDQAGVVRQQRGRPAAKEEDHFAQARLSRRDDRRREPDRTRLRARRFRPADRSHPACRMPVLLPRRAAGRERGSVRRAARRQPRAIDPARGARHGRRILRRARDGGGRRHRAAGDLFRSRFSRS